LQKLKTGDLVMMTRKHNPGLGVIIRIIPDITEVLQKGWDDLEEIIETWNSTRDYSIRMKSLDIFSKNFNDEQDLRTSFLLTNGFYQYALSEVVKTKVSIKIKYVKIFWVSRPVTINLNFLNKRRDWYPYSWVKKINREEYLTDSTKHTILEE